MSKKRFTTGMEDLLHEASQTSPVYITGSPKSSQNVASIEGNTLPVEGISLIGDHQPVAPVRRSNGKKFSDDLQTFLQEAFDDSFEKYSDPNYVHDDSSNKKRSLKPMAGLDAILRSTVDPKSMKIGPGNTRRLTLVFDESKLNKLKSIARMERSYLKDIIDEIVESFIREYEIKKGNLE
ncbi:MAG: hypothetical protein EBS35_01900 [Bacteroidetes bacterium]|nr:hypothetical protein [Bacteroidota bacterium]